MILLSEIPNSWITTPIKELGIIQTGNTPSKKDQSNYGDYIPLVKPPELNDQIIDDAYDHLSKKGAGKARILSEDSVLISCIGNLGKTAMNKKPVAFNQQINSITFYEGIHSKYGFYYFQSPFARNQLEALASATTIPIINKSKFSNIQFPIAPYNEQVRIVGRVEELFSRLDAGVRSLQAAQTQLEQYRQTTLKQAYTGKLTQKWRQKNPTKIKLVTEEVDIKPYRNLITWDIPTEWKWASLGSLIESMKNGIYKPKKFYSNDGIACLRMYNIENGKIVWKDIKRMILTEDELIKYLLKPDDILINRVNSRELVGKAAVIPPNLEPSVYESKNIRMRINQDTGSSYYVHYWMHFFSSRYFNLNAQQVVGMASINQTQISNMPIPMTTMKEQEKIVEIINNISLYLERISQTILKNSLLTTHLKNSILKKSFEGRLVPQDPRDEPASVLLYRINAQRVKQRKLV